MNESEKKDEEVALLVQSGRIELFGVIIKRYEKKIRRYALKVLHRQEDVQDVVQEVFIKAYVNIKSFDPKRKFSSWLYRIAHNEIINLFKKNKRRNFLPIFNLDVFFPYYARDGKNSADSPAEQKEIKKIINLCLSELGEKYREPIALYYLEEFSYKEIADIMKIPIATVGIRIKRAKKMLKKIFEKKDLLLNKISKRNETIFYEKSEKC